MTYAAWPRVRWRFARGLPIFGKLLDHAQAQTTTRYAHLARDTIETSTPRMAHQTDTA